MKYLWTNKVVLLAEDDEASAVYLSELLKLHQATVIQCSSGLTAFFHCMNNPNIDLVIMDMKLPELNGYESTRLIKKYQPFIPVIAVTACAMLEDKRRCKVVGCDGYLAKPVMPNEFLPLVNQYLNGEGKKNTYQEYSHH